MIAQHNWTRGGLHFRDITFEAPFDHFGRTGDAPGETASAGATSGGMTSASVNLPDTLSVFARIIATEPASTKPYLVFLQGGPGVEAPRPVTPVGGDSWLARALADFRVVMLDQRGTGRSNPIGSTAGTITGLESVGEDASAIAEALACFRADSIVEDAEILRGHLGVDTWSLLGQSFGGFTALRYVSEHASSLS